MHSIASSSECQQILDSKPQVMLKFSAEWCAPCKAAAPIIEKMAPQFPDVYMAEVDIDKSQDLASMYSVSAVPSFVFFHNKIEVDRVKGADIAKVTAALRSLAARTPSFGKGHRVGSSRSLDGAAASGSKPPPSAAEIRAARTRALEKRLSAGAAGAADAEKKAPAVSVTTISTHADTLAASAGAAPARVSERGLELVQNLLYYLALYVCTLFSFDARSKALSMQRKKD